MDTSDTPPQVAEMKALLPAALRKDLSFLRRIRVVAEHPPKKTLTKPSPFVTPQIHVDEEGRT